MLAPLGRQIPLEQADATGDGWRFCVLSVSVAAGYIFGLLIVGASLAATVLVLTWKLMNFRLLGHYPSEVPGWASLVCMMLFLGGMQFLILGIMGEFLRRIYNEAKQRPRWIVREAFGVQTDGIGRHRPT